MSAPAERAAAALRDAALRALTRESAVRAHELDPETVSELAALLGLVLELSGEEQRERLLELHAIRLDGFGDAHLRSCARATENQEMVRRTALEWYVLARLWNACCAPPAWGALAGALGREERLLVRDLAETLRARAAQLGEGGRQRRDRWSDEMRNLRLRAGALELSEVREPLVGALRRTLDARGGGPAGPECVLALVDVAALGADPDARALWAGSAPVASSGLVEAIALERADAERLRESPAIIPSTIKAGAGSGLDRARVRLALELVDSRGIPESGRSARESAWEECWRIAGSAVVVRV